MPVDRLLADLETAVGQLPYQTRHYEAFIVAQVLQQHANHHRTTAAIGDVLPAVLARLNLKLSENTTTGNGPEPA